MKHHLTLLGLCLTCLCPAQVNLVLNPSFEDYIECPQFAGEFAGYVTDWTTYFATPDYLNCGFVRTPNYDYELPRTGTGFVGAYHYSSVTNNYFLREYLHGTLSRPLEKDSIYYVEFHVKPFGLFGFIDKYQLALTSMPIDSASPANGVLNLNPAIAHTGGVITEFTEYTKISGCFISNGDERYLTIGNFYTDPETDFVPSPELVERSNYSFIDDVAIFAFNFDHLRSFDTVICQGSCISVPNGIGGEYEWQFVGASPGSSSEQAPEQICYDEPGVYDISVIVDHCAGQDTLLLEGAVTVVPRPALSADTVQALALVQGDSLPLTPCASAEAYDWSPAEGLSCTDCPSPVAAPDRDIRYTLQAVNGGQCAQTCAYDIRVLERPVPAFSLPVDTLCTEDCIAPVFTGDDAGANLVRWSFEGGSPAQSTVLSPAQVCFNTPGTYTVSLELGNEADTLSASRELVVLPMPSSLPAPQAYQLDFGDTLSLAPCASGSSYRWLAASPLSCTDCPGPVLRAVGNDTLLLEVSNGADCEVRCSYALSVTVPDNIYLPTAFSPNGDGRNDYFQPLGPYHEVLLFEVYDRWGGLMYKGTGPDARWDGTTAGKPVPPGLYAYRLRYVDTRTGREKTAAGGVSLVR